MKLGKIVDTIARYIDSKHSISLFDGGEMIKTGRYQVDVTSAKVIDYAKNSHVRMLLNCELSLKISAEYADIGSLFLLLKKCEEDADADHIGIVRAIENNERVQIFGNGFIRQSIAFTFSNFDDFDKILERVECINLNNKRCE